MEYYNAILNLKKKQTTNILAQARSLKRKDDEGYRTEFIRLWKWPNC